MIGPSVSTRRERRKRLAAGWASAVLLLASADGCRKRETTLSHGHSAESWAVTAFCEGYEIFAEVQPLVAGQAASSNTHVTVLSDFSPLRDGTVSAILRGSTGETTFTQDKPRREGIFVIEIRPQAEGSYDLLYRVERAGRVEDVPAGRVQVGNAARPGGLVEPPRPPNGLPEGEEGGTNVSFLKEQQWKTAFATTWVREGRLPARVVGPARVVPAAGGEATLAASVDASIAPQPWPYVGQTVAAGAPVLRLVPRVGEGRSLASLEAEAAALESEESAARARVGRLEALLATESVSVAEVERAKAAAAGLAAKLRAARRDLDTAAAARTGTVGATTIPLRAPFAARVAEVTATPSQAVSAGTPLVRLVRPRPVWLELSLPPAEASRVQALGGLYLRRAGEAASLEIPASQVRLVSRAPEVDPRTATLSLVIEVDRGTDELPIGSAVEAEALIGGESETGALVPAEAIVDDNGALVVYEQGDGESFTRREVRLVARAGTQALVQGIEPGARVVSRGSATVRRTSLLSAGAPEGHVH